MTTNKHRTQLELLQGGRDDAAGSDDWRDFCRHIGWQQLSEPALPNDYEEQMATRIFGRADNVITLHPANHRTQSRWRLVVGIAIIALVVGAALLARRDRNGPPTADTVPKPVPEMTPVQPVERLPQGPPHVERQLQHARMPVRANREVASSIVPIESTETIEPPAISPDAEPGTRAFPTLALLTPLVPDTDALAGVTSRAAHAGWRHLAAASPPDGGRAMALVDVVQAGRALSESL